jgi:hypothetical protein
MDEDWINITQEFLEDVIVKELAIDLHNGNFYKEVDDDTLEMCLVQLWEDGTWNWGQRGVILGEA